MGGKNTEWIDVTVISARPAAVCVTNGRHQAWVPRACILDTEDELEMGAATRIEVPVDVLEEKGLV